MAKARWLALASVISIAVLLASPALGQSTSEFSSSAIFDYTLTNDGGIRFADEFQRLGGVDTLGYPASYRFQLADGFTYQLTQGALLQWRPRLGGLTHEAIKARYLANPNPQVIPEWNVDRSIELYGLPMSYPERFGPFISQRFQRVALQLWLDEVPGMPAPGSVVRVLAGDLM